MKCNNIIALGTRILYAKMMHKRIPFQISLRVTEECNQNCSYCLNDYHRRGVKAPTTKQLLEMIDGFAKLGTKHITLLGGEPFLRNDIHDIVCRIKKHKINCSLTTNGRLIDKHIAVLKDLDLLSVSLDGDKFAHDSYRGDGSYEAAIHAIKVAQTIGVSVQLICTVTNLTDFKLQNLIIIAERYNCMLTFELLNPLFNSDGTVTLRPEDAGKKGIDLLIDYQLKNRNSRILISTYVLKYVRDWPFSYNVFRLFRKQIPTSFKPIWCYAGRFSAFIETNGDLMPCCLIRADYRPVNVFKLGVKEAWRQMPENDCVTCRTLGCNMFNALFALQLSTLFNFLRVAIKKRF